MEAIIKKKTFFMSLFMGIAMGLVFTLFAQIKNGQIMPIGIIVGILISMVISVVLGMIIPIKKLYDSANKKLNITEEGLKMGMVNSLISDLIFTPLNCTFGMWFGMSMGLKNLPPDVTTIFDRLMFCAKLPQFVPALISTLIIDLVIGFVLCILISPFLNKITNKICGI